MNRERNCTALCRSQGEESRCPRLGKAGGVINRHKNQKVSEGLEENI